MLPLLLVLGLNLVVSYFNARACGQMWAEREASGPFMFLVIWSAAIQAAIGFSSVLIFGEVYLAHAAGILPEGAMKATVSLWYLAVIVPALGTGLLITIRSWIVAYRERNLMTMGTAAYNTVVMAHNLYGAASGIGEAIKGVGDFLPSADDDSGAGTAIFVLVLLVALVALSLAGGILITRGIIRHYAGTLAMPERRALA